MGAEAVVFFDQKLGHDFLYLRKQGMQLASKMRFISAQFDALFTGDLWHRTRNMPTAWRACCRRSCARFRR